MMIVDDIMNFVKPLMGHLFCKYSPMIQLFIIRILSRYALLDLFAFLSENKHGTDRLRYVQYIRLHMLALL